MHRAPSQKSLDLKLARIVADPSCQDFILADAKDADMAFGLAAPGVRRGGIRSAGRSVRSRSFASRSGSSSPRDSSTSC